MTLNETRRPIIKNLKIRKSMVLITILALLGLPTFMGSGAAANSDMVVFAAASTTNAIDEIGALYSKRYPGRIITSFASSATLAKQIANGAPADIYLSANKKWMDYLEKKNLIDKKNRFDLLSNRIVLIVPAGSSEKHIEVVPGFPLAAMLGKDGRLSMGDPNHVPAGMYGKKSLHHLGVWEQVKDRLAPMKDVRAALVLVGRTETPLGIVYATDAVISRKVRVVGTFPADSHPAIVYPVAAVSRGKISEAKPFLNFLTSPEARAVFEKHGFVVR